MDLAESNRGRTYSMKLALAEAPKIPVLPEVLESFQSHSLLPGGLVSHKSLLEPAPNGRLAAQRLVRSFSAPRNSGQCGAVERRAGGGVRYDPSFPKPVGHRVDRGARAHRRSAWPGYISDDPSEDESECRSAQECISG